MPIYVCSPRDQIDSCALHLCVGSWAVTENPPEWKDLWKLSPLSTVEGGVAVPGFADVRSMTMENAWQFLKIWPDENGWQEDRAMAAFRSTCAIRYPRGKKLKAVGHYWGEDGSILDYVEARRRIYCPCYLEMLRIPDRAEVIQRLREASLQKDIYMWDPDSYDITRYGMTDIAEAIEYTPKPFAHAFLVAFAVMEKIELLG